MLTSTFIHAQDIGEKTEKRIWESGLLTWEQYLAGCDACRLSQRQRDLLQPVVEESVRRFSQGDHTYFASTVPSREHWRAYKEFGDKAVFLDIETVGMGDGDAITVIGLYDGVEVKSFVKGVNMESFEDEIGKYQLIVTYAGAGFDLPHIRREFKGLQMDQMHIDLCHALHRLGLKGGLKKIEQCVGICRPDDVHGLDGWDAVRLWNEYEWGSGDALDMLLAYNAQDVINLKVLAEMAYAGLRTAAIGPCAPTKENM